MPQQEMDDYYWNGLLVKDLNEEELRFALCEVIDRCESLLNPAYEIKDFIDWMNGDN